MASGAACLILVSVAVMSLVSGAYSSLTTTLKLPSFSMAGIRNFLNSCENGNWRVLIAMVLTPADFIILTSSAARRSGMAEVVNQILPGLTSRIVVDAAEFPTTGKWYFSRMPTMEK